MNARPPRAWTGPNLFSLLFLLLALAIWLRPFADLDFTWQVRTGGEVVAQRSIHVADNFTYTLHGQTLPDFEWLYEVYLWKVWTVAGYGGLHLLKVLCVLAPLVLAGWRLRRAGVGWHVVLPALTVAVLVFIPAWNLRPFYLTTLGLLLLSGWLHDHCAGRRRLSWEVPLLMLIWGNAHPGVITGQGLLLGAIAWEWLNRWLTWNRPLDRAACGRLTMVGGLGLLASLLCPDPLLRLQYTFDPDLRHPIMRGFVEIMPLHWFAFQAPYLAALVYPVAAVVLYAFVRRFREVRLWEFALLAGVAFLGSYAYRAAQDFLLIWLVVGLPHVVALYRRAAPRGVPVWMWNSERWLKRVLTAPAFRPQPGWALLTLGVLAVVSVSLPFPRPHGNDWPLGAGEFIAREQIQGNFFTDPNRGAYLVWRLGPERARCWADTRGFFFPPRVLEDCVFVLRTHADWETRLERVLDGGTDWLLLPVRGPDNALTRALEGKVAERYRDEEVVLLEAGEVRAWLEAHRDRRPTAGASLNRR